MNSYVLPWEGLPPLSDRHIEGRPLLTCPAVDVGSNMRLWYVPRMDDEVNRAGFDFFVGNMVCGPAMHHGEHTVDLMAHPETVAECIFRGVAFFDGVRHLYMGEEDKEEQGYVYYPDVESMALALVAILALEHSLCPFYRDRG